MALNTWGGENWRFSTEIAVYLGYGMIQAYGCYVTLIGNHGGGSIRVISFNSEWSLSRISGNDIFRSRISQNGAL